MANIFTGFGTIETFLKQIVTAINGVAIAIGNAFPAPLTSSATYDPPNIANGSSASTTVAVSGAAFGNTASASFSLDLQGLVISAYVSAANVVTVILSNSTGGSVNLASGTLFVRVIQ